MRVESDKIKPGSLICQYLSKDQTEVRGDTYLSLIIEFLF